MKWSEYAEVGQEHRVAKVHYDGTIFSFQDGSVWISRLARRELCAAIEGYERS